MKLPGSLSFSEVSKGFFKLLKMNYSPFPSDNNLVLRRLSCL